MVTKYMAIIDNEPSAADEAEAGENATEVVAASSATTCCLLPQTSTGVRRRHDYTDNVAACADESSRYLKHISYSKQARAYFCLIYKTSCLIFVCFFWREPNNPNY